MLVGWGGVNRQTNKQFVLNLLAVEIFQPTSVSPHGPESSTVSPLFVRAGPDCLRGRSQGGGLGLGCCFTKQNNTAKKEKL